MKAKEQRQVKDRYVGDTECRINKMMRMCLQWQFDIRIGNERPSAHYFKKYHVGKYPKHFFADLSTAVIDRQYIIDKMNAISSYRREYDKSKGVASHNVVIRQVAEISGKRTKKIGDVVEKYVKGK